MNRTASFVFASMASLMSVAFVSAAESTVTLEKTHICCAKCVKAVEKVVAGVPNAKVVIDQPTGKVTLTVPNEETGQKAIDALVAAGFYGKATGATVKADSGAPAGTVKTLTITTHNCCKKCAAAINGIIKTVPGATGTAEPAVESITIAGDFDTAKLVEAFNDAGFMVKAAK